MIGTPRCARKSLQKESVGETRRCSKQIMRRPCTFVFLRPISFDNVNRLLFAAIGPLPAIFFFHLGRTGAVGTGDETFLFGFCLYLVFFLLAGFAAFEDNAFGHNLFNIHRCMLFISGNIQFANRWLRHTLSAVRRGSLPFLPALRDRCSCS